MELCICWWYQSFNMSNSFHGSAIITVTAHVGPFPPPPPYLCLPVQWSKSIFASFSCWIMKWQYYNAQHPNRPHYDTQIIYPYPNTTALYMGFHISLTLIFGISGQTCTFVHQCKFFFSNNFSMFWISGCICYGPIL
jgi:hypothetical protein